MYADGIWKYEAVRDFLAILIKNPSVTVLPVNPSGVWKPPYALIQGSVEVEGKSIYAPTGMELTGTDKSLPLRFNINDPLSMTKPKGKFKFFVSSCTGYSTYEVGLTFPPAFNSPKAKVKDAQDGSNYTVNFKVKEGCKKYREPLTGEIMTVSCEDGISVAKKGKFDFAGRYECTKKVSSGASPFDFSPRTSMLSITKKSNTEYNAIREGTGRLLEMDKTGQKTLFIHLSDGINHARITFSFDLDNSFELTESVSTFDGSIRTFKYDCTPTN